MQTKFTDVLESVESLPVDEKEMLVDIVRNRLIEERRAQIRSDIENSKRQYESGMCDELTADEIMNEVLS